MNYDECLKQTIRESVVDALERMKTLEAEDRYTLLCEWGEYMFSEYETEEVLMVPQLEKDLKT